MEVALAEAMKPAEENGAGAGYPHHDTLNRPLAEMSKSQQKSRRRRLAEIRAEVQRRLSSRQGASGVRGPAPRYDEVFSSGVQWLDSLAGDAVPERATGC